MISAAYYNYETYSIDLSLSNQATVNVGKFQSFVTQYAWNVAKLTKSKFSSVYKSRFGTKICTHTHKNWFGKLNNGRPFNIELEKTKKCRLRLPNNENHPENLLKKVDPPENLLKKVDPPEMYVSDKRKLTFQISKTSKIIFRKSYSSE